MFFSRTITLQKILRCLTCEAFKHILKSMRLKFVLVLNLIYGYHLCKCRPFGSKLYMSQFRTSCHSDVTTDLLIYSSKEEQNTYFHPLFHSLLLKISCFPVSISLPFFPQTLIGKGNLIDEMPK